MTDKELIRQEIERRIKEGSSKNDISEGALALNSLLDFIDSIPDKPESKDLEEEIDRFEDWINNFNQSDYPTSYTVRDIARHFAEWQKQQIMKDAVELTITNTSFIPLPKLDIKAGDKVKIIITKTEQQ